MTPARDRGTFLVAVVLAALFALLYTPYWHRGGDSDVYLAIARHIARGEGLRFNGNPVVVVPPLWPMLLAGAMKVSTSFLWLKLLPFSLLVAGLVVWFRILLRWLRPTGAAAIIFLTALSPLIFPLSTLFFGEPLYIVLTGAALLLALQIGEGKPPVVRGGALALLLIAAIGVRWTAPLWWPLVAAALLSTQDARRRYANAFIAALMCIITVAGFYLQRWLLGVDPSQVDYRYDWSLAVRYSMSNVVDLSDLLSRIANAGAWIGGLFWPPTRELGALRWPGLILGWVVLIPMVVWSVVEARRMRLLPLAALIHVAALVVLWPNIVPRYLVPLLPLMYAFAWLTLRQLLSWRSAARTGEIRADPLQAEGDSPSLAAKLLGIPFFASIALCGISFFAVELWVSRFGDFYSRFQAGTNRSLIDAIERLRSENPSPTDVAINRCDINYRRQRIGNGWLRAASVLLDLPIRNPPDDLCRPPDEGVARWVQEQNIRFLLHRQPSLTMWHFPMTPDSAPPSPTGEPWTGQWQLYELVGGRLEQVDVSAGTSAPKRLRGL